MLGNWKKTLPIALAAVLIAGAAVAGGAAIKAKQATAGKTASAGHCDGHDAAMAAGTACEGKGASAASAASAGACAEHEANMASGTACKDHDAAMAAGRCPVSGASMASAGDKCPFMGASGDMAKACGVKANQAMYSFAVPTADCESCVKGIQSAAMAMKGVACVHVDLDTHTAYIIADKATSTKAVAAAIAKAGYKNSYKGEGSKVEAEFAKAMSGAGTDGSMSHCAHKEKDKV